MTRICGFDIETTGLDFEKDHITEVAYVIKDVGDHKPLCIESKLVAIPSEFQLSREIVELTGITDKHMAEAYVSPLEALVQFSDDLVTYEVDYVVAHNGANFDRPFINAVSKRFDQGVGHWEQLDWLDTRADVVYPASFTSHRLTHLAAEYGFVNPFPHQALFDVMTMFKVLEHQDLEAVIQRSKEPWLTLLATLSYDRREEAKKLRYRWESDGYKTYPKTWVKRIKAGDLLKEKAQATFDIKVIGDT